MPLPDHFERTLAGARAGEEWAWREIHIELAPVLIGYLRGRGAADAEDVAGEAFVQIVRDLRSFEGDWRGFRAWALAIARHRLFDARRRDARRPDEPHPDPAAHEPAGDVSEDAIANLELDRVASLLAELSPDQRDVVLLRVIGDLSIEETARVIGKRRGAVKQLQRRGLAAIKRRLERETVP
jgi:RNA polymerase sigma factor (sigma-70 family)